MYFVYLLECRGGSIYTGIATDVKRRFEEHAGGTGARYTRSHPPRRILYTEEYVDRSSAQKREATIKSWDRKQKLTLVSQQPKRRQRSRSSSTAAS
jgi:putative endonuclease